MLFLEITFEYQWTQHHGSKDGVKVNQCVASWLWMYCSLGPGVGVGSGVSWQGGWLGHFF